MEQIEIVQGRYGERIASPQGMSIIEPLVNHGTYRENHERWYRLPQTCREVVRMAGWPLLLREFPIHFPVNAAESHARVLRRWMQQERQTDARARRDAREQFLAKLSEVTSCGRGLVPRRLEVLPLRPRGSARAGELPRSEAGRRRAPAGRRVNRALSHLTRSQLRDHKLRLQGASMMLRLGYVPIPPRRRAKKKGAK